MKDNDAVYLILMIILLFLLSIGLHYLYEYEVVWQENYERSFEGETLEPNQ